MSAVLELSNYPIHVGSPWPAFRRMLSEREYSQLLVIADHNTRRHCWPLLREALPEAALRPIVVPPGERRKNLDTCRYIWQEMMAAGADRRALVINLGGGVIGDMGGFCAGTFKRGVDFVQVPTTLLSQVDASIGGKLGIDFGGIKNSIGLFADPQAVFIDPAFLKTLPQRELRSGFAEMVKHALIADSGHWRQLQALADLEQVDWPALLLPSLRIKQRIVEADPYEHGLRKALNFGHTIGHAVEGLALQSDLPLLHGEAVAVGMVAEAWLSHREKLLSAGALQAVVELIFRHFGKVALQRDDYPRYHELMRNDKKNEGGQVLFSLIGPLGAACINRPVPAPLIEEALDYYQKTPLFKNKIAPGRL